MNKHITRKQGVCNAPLLTAILALASAFTFNACTDEGTIQCGIIKRCEEPEPKCGEDTYDDKELGCCNSNLYSLANQRCQNGNAVETKCGSNWYVPSATEFCVNGSLTSAKGEFTDARDGKTYKYVSIGTQNWMAENLNYAAQGSKCYNDDPANCQKYGRLYNWETSVEACPDGWHPSSEAEWETMVSATGGYKRAAKKLKTASGWGEGKNGTDEYGFSALPSGNVHNAQYRSINSSTSIWSAADFVPDGGFMRIIYHEDMVLPSGMIDNYAHWVETMELVENVYMNSVRCIQGNPPPKPPPPVLPPSANASSFGTLTDPRDGKTYKTVKIGTQTWMAENLNYDSGDFSRCYNNEPANCQKYGRLYEYARGGSCPSGWHIPNVEEWAKLFHYADGTSSNDEIPYESRTAGLHLKAEEGWGDYNDKGVKKSGNSTDRYGFAALPGGYYDRIDKNFYAAGFSAYLMTDNFRVGHYMFHYYGGVGWSLRVSDAYMSIRCLKD